MKKLLLLNLLFAMACNNSQKEKSNTEEGYIVTPSKFSYKIFRSSTGGDSILKGDVVKLYLEQYIDDSLMNDNRTTMPEFVKIDSTLREFDYTEILPLLRVNDSAVCIFPVTEILKRAAATTYPPGFMTGRKEIRVRVKVIQRFASDSAAMQDYGVEKGRYDAERNAWEKAGYENAAKSFDSLLLSAGKDLIRLPNGVCIRKIEMGAGPKIKKNDSINVVYRGKLQNGKEFEVTTAKKPFGLHAGNFESVEGFDTGISALSYGDSAIIYIPTKLAYAAGGAGKTVPPFSNLIFEVRILNR